MAASLSPIVAPAGIQAGTPFVGNASGGDGLFVKQTNPAIAVSTPLIHINVTTSPPQIQIGPFSAALGAAQITGATVIGSGAVGTTGGLGNIVVIGTNASVGELQDSVAIGHGANTGVTTAANGAVAIGPSATVGGAAANAGGGIAIGNAAVANNGVAIGVSATCNLGQVAIGSASTAKNFGVAVGGGADAEFGGGHGLGAIAIGRSATANESTDVVIGTGNGGTASGQGGNVLLASGVGGSGVSGANCIVIGSSSNAGGASPNPASASASFCTVIGGNSTSANTGAHILGRGVSTTAINQTLIGGVDDPCASAFFGNGVVAASPQNVVIGVTGGSGTNVAGASHTVAGGIATGSAAGGSIVFQTSVAAASSATPQALATALTIDNTQTCTFANPAFVTNTAPGGAGSKTGTLTNLPPAATAGDPQTYLTFKNGAHTYAIPAYQIA